MAKYSNREMRQQVLDERKAKNKILIQAKEYHDQLRVTSGQLEHSREKNRILLEWQVMIKGTWIYRICKYIRLV